jgi:hypothetical protein
MKAPFPFLFFDRLPIRSSASDETDPEKDAREDSKGNQRQVHRLTEPFATFQGRRRISR